MSDTFLPGSGFDTYEEQDKVLVGLCGGTGCTSSNSDKIAQAFEALRTLRTHQKTEKFASN